MYTIKRTNANNKDFQKLVVELDKELAIRDGEDHAFYAQLNKIAVLKNAVVLYENDVAVGCGATRAYQENIMEIKRMYVLPEKRGKGIASVILKELENWTKQLGFKKCILETGMNQPEAISLYKKNNFVIIKNYGQYAEIYNSVCFEKILI